MSHFYIYNFQNDTLNSLFGTFLKEFLEKHEKK